MAAKTNGKTLEFTQGTGGLAQATARTLGMRILNGDVVPGDYFANEGTLFETLNVGRSTLREAFRILSSKGLIGSRQRSGTFVRPREDWNVLDPQVIVWMSELGNVDAILSELYEYRRILEPEAARLAATRAGDRQREQIAQAHARLEAAIGDRDREVQADIDLHVQIVLAAGNRFFIPLATAIKMLMRLGIERATLAPNPLTKSIDLHHNVAEAIQSRDGDSAEFAMRGLIECAIRDFRNAKAKDLADGGP